MKYYNLINKVISTNIFPNLNKSDLDVIIYNINRIIECIDHHMNIPNLYNQLSSNSYKDIHILINMIIPYIEEPVKKKLQSLHEIPYGKFTNLRYNLGFKYVYGIKDIIASTTHLIKITIPTVINKLYVNWVDIFPDLQHNTGFNSIIKFIPDHSNITDDDLLNTYIQSNIKKDRDKWEKATYFFISDSKTKRTYKDVDYLLDEWSNLSENKKQNWFNVETFYWLSQIHFFNHFLANRVIYMTAGTGVGKSTHIPKLVLYSLMAFENIQEPRIIITQPRQIPAKDVPEYISAHMGISIPKYREQLKKNLDDDSNDVNDVNNLNKDINYYVQFHHGDDSFITSNKKHRTLKYVTDQLLFNELLENPTLIDPFTGKTLYDVILIDEAHEHNIRMDLILTLMKYTLQHNSQIRLMIISATIDDDEARYRQFFNDIDDNTTHIDRRLHVSNPLHSQNYPITDHWEKSPVNNYIEEGIKKIKHILNTSYTGDILFFLTGVNDINNTCERLNNELVSNVIALPLYGVLEPERQEYAKSTKPRDIIIDRTTAILPLIEQIKIPSRTYTRKIILATSIAEASITIENLYYVIDIGFTNTPIYNTNTKLMSMKPEPISYSSHRQRRGRVGRKYPGDAYYLYTKNDIKDSKIIADIKKNNLANDIFPLIKNNKVCEYCYDKDTLLDSTGEFYIVHPEDDHNKRSDMGLFINPIQQKLNHHLTDAFEYLEELKLITNKGYKTKLGIFIGRFNDISKLDMNNKLAIIYSILSNYQIYIIPILSFIFNNKFDTFFDDLEKGLLLFESNSSDHITIYKIYTTFIKDFPNLFINTYSIAISKLIINNKLSDNLEVNNEKEIYDTFRQNCNNYYYKYNITDKNVSKIVDKETIIIDNWCKSHYINVSSMLSYLSTVSVYKYYANKMEDIIKNNINQINKYILPYNKYGNILKILIDSNPRNIGIVNSDGYYESKYNVLLSVTKKKIPYTRIELPVTVYNKSYDYIYYSSIRAFETEVNISFISGIPFNNND